MGSLKDSDTPGGDPGINLANQIGDAQIRHVSRGFVEPGRRELACKESREYGGRQVCRIVFMQSPDRRLLANPGLSGLHPFASAFAPIPALHPVGVGQRDAPCGGQASLSSIRTCFLIMASLGECSSWSRKSFRAWAPVRQVEPLLSPSRAPFLNI